MGSEWLSYKEMKAKFLEYFTEKKYQSLIEALERLVIHPYSKAAKDFIMEFRKEVKAVSKQIQVPPLMLDHNARPYMTGKAMRKYCIAEVVVRGNGTGKVDINGKDLLYFEFMQDREQVMSPLVFCGLLFKVDIECKTYHEEKTKEWSKDAPPLGSYRGPERQWRELGTTAQSGAIRLALALALRSFVDEKIVERMRLAGLLTADIRHRERKKWGQEGARRNDCRVHAIRVGTEARVKAPNNRDSDENRETIELNDICISIGKTNEYFPRVLTVSPLEVTFDPNREMKRRPTKEVKCEPTADCHTSDPNGGHHSKYTNEEISSANTLVSLMAADSGDQTNGVLFAGVKDTDAQNEVICESTSKSDSLPSMDSISSAELVDEIKAKPIDGNRKAGVSPPKYPVVGQIQAPVYSAGHSYGYYPMDPSMGYGQYYPMYPMAPNYGPQVGAPVMHPNYAPMAPMAPQMHGMNPNDRQCPYCMATNQSIRPKMN
ncbi:unnamed protein product [Medioppia subpectinata]|uniref:Uncharacterized protein n=1 Tax=Medioppia subpectinata TaxID=1979941 RepID=A0A7R9KY40_9ACAR|nr:unnamed protein product [Medioppia subpectinata]CAG2111975.1 unnamed protein product [Medioppia subpectinata]